MPEDAKIPLNRFRRGIFISSDGDIYTPISGEIGLRLTKILGATPDDSRQALLQMRRVTGWSRAQLASVLGVSKETLRRWETGARHPSAAARRLIWFAESLFLEPQRLLDLPSLLSWGKI